MTATMTAHAAHTFACPSFAKPRVSTQVGRAQKIVHRSSDAALPVHLFLDFSNIAIGAKDLAAEKGDGWLKRSDVRLHLENFKHLVQRDRTWGSGYAAAGLYRGEVLKANAEKLGIRFDVCERGNRTNTEQGVDEKIQAAMVKMLLPYFESNPPAPGIIALATGDGNGHLDGVGFLPLLRAFHILGFQIEVLSWRDSLNPVLGDWAAQHGQLIELDGWYQELTYVEYGRQAKSARELYFKLAQQQSA